MSKQDRQGVRTAEDLERKHNWGKRFTEVLGVATDAQEKAEGAITIIGQTNERVLQAETSITRNSEEITMRATRAEMEAGYTSRAEFEAELAVIAQAIEMNFTTASDQISSVSGDMQAQLQKLYKYIKFSGETAISISSGNSAVTLELDNDKGIVFKKNGVEFGKWDGDNFYTGNIVLRLNERAQFGNFAFVPRSDGSLSFFKVGG